MKLQPLKFVRDALSETPGGLPSSARVIGAVLFGIVALAVGATTFVLLWRIFFIADSDSLKILVDGLSKFQWQFLYLSATALALYGINVFKQIAQIRAGSLFNIEDNPNMMNPYGMGGMGGMYGGMGMYNRPPYMPMVTPTTIGQGGTAGTQVIKTVTGQPVEPHTTPVQPKMPTAEAGVGSDD